MSRASASQEGQRPRLLLIDDESQILSALERSLRREGYEIILAEGPRKGLAELARGRVDAIVSDHKMPGMSGLELLAEAGRQQPAAHRILITGWPEAISSSDVQRLGLAAVVPKPWDDAALKAALRKVLAPS